MINYTLCSEKPHRHFIQFEAEFPAQGELTLLQLPSWRPGRYELGNFAQNIRAFKAYADEGGNLQFRKISKDTWEVKTSGISRFKISYEYYASVINAGSSYLGEKLLYVNPVNCFFYIPGQESEEFEINLDVPEAYQIAGQLEKNDQTKTLKANGVQELMDSPFIASPNLSCTSYKCGNTTFNIWIEGSHNLDMQQMLDEFSAFTEAQIKAFGDIPCVEYDFLFFFLPYKAYHGVEHERSTVITLGPADALLKKSFYNELLGVSCHELYHTWNIKNIRPAEMMPYAFDRENYSRLGYVAEGVTTYFGDQFLHRSNVFSDEEYLHQLSILVQRHMDNPGRKNFSVAESSFDTWLDGYTPGIPWRKVSIYNEGALCAFICDVEILKATRGESSLDDVMNLLYERFGKTSTGYTENDYKQLLEEVSGISFDSIFNDLIWGTADFLPYLESAFDRVGLKLNREDSSVFSERCWGCRINSSNKITSVLPDSNADRSGLWIDDQVVAINDRSCSHDLQDLAASFDTDELSLTIKRDNELFDRMIHNDQAERYLKWTVKLKESASDIDRAAFKMWKRES